MGIGIQISTSQDVYFAGDVVKGTVTLTVTEDDAKDPLDHDLILRLDGRATARGPDKKTISGKVSKKLLLRDVQLDSFHGKAATGSHSYPYSLPLPLDLPSSMKCGGNVHATHIGIGCEIAYRLEVQLLRSGGLEYKARNEVHLNVFAGSRVTPVTPVLVGPETHVVYTLFRTKRGMISLGFKTDRSVVGHNGSISITVVARNDSSFPIKAMRVKVKQEVEWLNPNYGHHSLKEKKILKSSFVPISKLDGLQRAVDKKEQQHGQSLADVTAFARRELEERLATGGGVRLKLFVPGTCLTTLMVPRLIEVRHYLRVSLDMARANSIKVGMPLRVQGGS